MGRAVSLALCVCGVLRGSGGVVCGGGGGGVGRVGQEEGGDTWKVGKLAENMKDTDNPNCPHHNNPQIHTHFYILSLLLLSEGGLMNDLMLKSISNSTGLLCTVSLSWHHRVLRKK